MKKRFIGMVVGLVAVPVVASEKKEPENPVATQELTGRIKRPRLPSDLLDQALAELDAQEAQNAGGHHSKDDTSKDLAALKSAHAGKKPDESDTFDV